MNKELIYDEQDNDWANDIKKSPIHISQAESGRKGYFCMGCTKEMLAVKGQIRKQHFRHDVNDVYNSKKECVHSSRIYREKLAYLYFMRVKEIKVPAVYKFPPKGMNSIPNLLQAAKTISAHRVDREVTFFEDQNGEIHQGKNSKIDERYLMVRPDAVFFDEHNKPILFLEFVITHKPDIDKLNKLQRLGIDTVQIIIPKLAEAELEKNISHVSKVKWTYNALESNTEYIQVSTGNADGIPIFDEDQRKLFEESYKCRAAQISNLIRSVKRCLGSKSYERIELHFEQEISRIENAAREQRTRLDDIQKRIESEIYSELENEREDFERRQKEFQNEFANLETRYYRKRETVSRANESAKRNVEQRYGIRQSEEEIRREYRRIESDVEWEFGSTERKILSEIGYIEREERNIGTEEETVDNAIRKNSSYQNDPTRIEQQLRERFRQLEESEFKEFERKTNDLRSKTEELSQARAEFETGLRSEFEGRLQQIIERVNKRDIQGRDELSERIKAILNIRGLLDSYKGR